MTADQLAVNSRALIAAAASSQDAVIALAVVVVFLAVGIAIWIGNALVQMARDRRGER